MTNIVYIAASLDGYIAGPGGDMDWLNTIPNPEGTDMGWGAFTDRIDAIVMGRKSFETVLGFDIGWPYTNPVFVVTNTLKDVPETLAGKVELISGTPREIIASLAERNMTTLYIDGAATIQAFLEEDLIDEMFIARIPILLGGGVPLFGSLVQPLEFEHIKTEAFSPMIVQSIFHRKRTD